MPPVLPSYIGTNAFPDRPPDSSINPQSYGRDAEALAKVGGDIGDIGARLLAARKQADDQDYVNKKSADGIISDHQTAINISQTYNKANIQPQGAPPAQTSSIDKNIPVATPTFNSDVQINTRDPSSNPSEQPKSLAGGPIGADGTVNYDPSGRADAIRKAQMDRLKQDLEAAPSDAARRKYESMATDRINNMYVTNLHQENIEKVAVQKSNLFSVNDKISEDMNAAPSMEKLYYGLKNLRDSLNASSSGKDPLLDPKEANDAYQKMAYSQVMNTFEGASKDPEVAKHFITELDNVQANKNGYEQINNAIGPKEINSIRNQLQSTIVTDSNAKITEIERRNTSRMAAINTFDPAIMAHYFNESSVRADMAQLDKLAADPYTKLDPSRVAESKLNMAIGMAGYKIMPQLAAIPPDQREARVALYDSKIAAVKNQLGISESSTGVQEAIRVKSSIEGAMSGLDKEFRSDPGGYMVAHGLLKSPPPAAGANYGQNQMDEMAGLIKRFGGDPRMGVLPSGKVAELKDRIGKEQNPDKAADMIMKLKADSGSWSNNVMHQITSGKGALSKQYAVAGMMDDKASAASLIDNVGAFETLKKAADDRDPQTYKDIRARVVQNFGPAFSAMAASGPYSDSTKNAITMQQGIIADALSQASKGTPWRQAADNAQKKFFDNNFQIVKGVNVPRKIGDTNINMDNVRLEMELAHNPEWMKSQGVLVAKGQAERFYNNLSDNSVVGNSLSGGKWIPDVDQKGATFNVYQNGAWNPVKLNAGGRAADSLNYFPGKHSDVVHIDFQHATDHPSPEAAALNNTLIKRVSAKLPKAIDAVSKTPAPKYTNIPGE